jgi:hypothetical protein
VKTALYGYVGKFVLGGTPADRREEFFSSLRTSPVSSNPKKPFPK